MKCRLKCLGVVGVLARYTGCSGGISPGANDCGIISCFSMEKPLRIAPDS